MSYLLEGRTKENTRISAADSLNQRYPAPRMMCRSNQYRLPREKPAVAESVRTRNTYIAEIKKLLATTGSTGEKRERQKAPHVVQKHVGSGTEKDPYAAETVLGNCLNKAKGKMQRIRSNLAGLQSLEPAAQSRNEQTNLSLRRRHDRAATGLGKYCAAAGHNHGYLSSLLQPCLSLNK